MHLCEKGERCGRPHPFAHECGLGVGEGCRHRPAAVVKRPNLLLVLGKQFDVNGPCRVLLERRPFRVSRSDFDSGDGVTVARTLSPRKGAERNLGFCHRRGHLVRVIGHRIDPRPAKHGTQHVHDSPADSLGVLAGGEVTVDREPTTLLVHQDKANAGCCSRTRLPFSGAAGR